MTTSNSVVLDEDKLYKVGINSVDKVLCVHCGKEAKYHHRFFDHYDEEEWYECDCETVLLLHSKRKEYTLLKKQADIISDEIKKLLSKESTTVKNLRIKKEIQTVLNKHKVGIDKVTEILKRGIE